MFSLILNRDATTKKDFEAVPEDVPKEESSATNLRILDLRWCRIEEHDNQATNYQPSYTSRRLR